MSVQRRLAIGVKHDHVAIMARSWGLTKKLVNGEKTIESRWYKHKVAPWNRIFAGDVVYFKDSGEPITVMASVRKVEQYENLTPRKIIQLLNKYAKADGLGIDKGSLRKFYYLFRDKKYCIIIFLKNIKAIEPFEIGKEGFGAQSAWLIVDDVCQIKT